MATYMTVSYTHLDVYKRQVYDIPIANNLATADFMLNSKFMNDTYSRRVENFNKTIQEQMCIRDRIYTMRSAWRPA